MSSTHRLYNCVSGNWIMCCRRHFADVFFTIWPCLPRWSTDGRANGQDFVNIIIDGEGIMGSSADSIAWHMLGRLGDVLLGLHGTVSLARALRSPVKVGW